MGEMDDVVKEFLVESYENLDRLDSDLLALETNPQAREMLASSGLAVIAAKDLTDAAQKVVAAAR